MGRTWGVKFWEPGTDRGILILIKKEEVRYTHAVGPNRVLTGPKNRKLRKNKRPSPSSMINAVTPAENHTTVITSTIPPPTGEAEENPLRKVMQATCDTLNRTRPELTENCWLCYDIQPLFYEAV